MTEENPSSFWANANPKPLSATPPPPPITQPQTLSSLAAMVGIGTPYLECKGLWYNGAEVKLDGYRFVNCRFDKCTLNSNSGNFELINCFVDEGTVVMHGNNNIKVIRLFNRSNEWMKDNGDLFAPTANADGTITIVE